MWAEIYFFIFLNYMAFPNKFILFVFMHFARHCVIFALIDLYLTFSFEFRWTEQEGRQE